MASAALQINVIPKRMLEKKESAHHCGRSVRMFETECPVRPPLWRAGACVMLMSRQTDMAGTPMFDRDAFKCALWPFRMGVNPFYGKSQAEAA